MARKMSSSIRQNVGHSNVISSAGTAKNTKLSNMQQVSKSKLVSPFHGISGKVEKQATSDQLSSKRGENSQKNNASFDGRERSQQSKSIQQNSAYHTRQKSENVSNPSTTNQQTLNERVFKSNTRSRMDKRGVVLK